MKAIFLSILSLLFIPTLSQERGVNHLDEVRLYSHFAPEDQFGFSIITLSDSILKDNNDKLSDLVNTYTTAYIKEQGQGMTASLSMRGSGASHTAVYWNGIPVNSSLNGQTDFNTVFTSLYNKIRIRKGGGSVLLGSGAIGGAINLKNEFKFNDKTTGSIFGGVGSFSSFTTALNISHSTDRIALQIGVNGITSKNKYPFYDTKVFNDNGEIKNYVLQINTGYKFNLNQLLYLKTSYTNSDRNTSRTLYMPSTAKLIYDTQRLLIGWKQNNGIFESELKSAYVKEKYLYVFSKENPDYLSNNGAKKWFSVYDIIYKLGAGIKLQSTFSYELLFGEGTDIQLSKQHKTGLLTALHHIVTKEFQYNLSIRKDFTSTYRIPFVFSIDSKQKWNKQHSTKFNFSTNFRTPTINDLYWEPGGNPDLKPEENWSIELGYNWRMPEKYLARVKTHNSTKINLYHSRSKNLIQWRPIAKMIWQPINIQSVTAQGLEFELHNSFSYNKHLLSIVSQYSYTISKDDETGNRLIYIPKHIAKVRLDYNFDKWFFSFSQRHIGSVFTTTSNTQNLKAYTVSSMGIKRKFLHRKLGLGLQIDNLLNEKYQIVLARPMPYRNFTLNFNYKF